MDLSHRLLGGVAVLVEPRQAASRFRPTARRPRRPPTPRRYRSAGRPGCWPRCRSASGRPCRAAPGRRRWCRPTARRPRRAPTPRRYRPAGRLGAGLAVGLPVAVLVEPRQAAAAVPTHSAPSAPLANAKTYRPAGRPGCWPCCRSASGRPCRAAPGRRGSDPQRAVRADRQRRDDRPAGRLGAGLAVGLPVAVLVEPRQAAARCRPTARRPRRPPTPRRDRPAGRPGCWPCCRFASGRPCRAAPGRR